MAHTKVTKNGTQNTGTANTFSYSGSFDVFKASEVEVELDNIALTFTTSTINESASPREYTVDYNNKTVHIGGANLTSNDNVVIQPVTDMGDPTPRATYAPGSSVTSDDLNNNQLQLMRKAMEYNEQKLSSRGGTMTGNLHLGQNVDLSFEGDTDNTYETTLTVADPTSDKTITFPDTTGTVVTTGDTGTVSTNMIAGDAITSGLIADNQINSEHYVDGSIDRVHLAADIVDGTKLADNAVNSEHYTDGSIDRVHLAADIVDGTKIADDSINSEHYVDGSIDTDHIADSQVTTAKIADDAVTAAKLANTSVTPGTYSATDLSVDAQGRITAASSGTIAGSEIAADAIDGTKIADDSINSEHYVDGSIDHQHLANDVIDGDNIQDDVINSEHIAADSLDTEHYAPTSIDSAALASNSIIESKITDANVTTDKIANDAITIGKIGCEQTTISDSDSHIPTSGAVVDYVAAQIAPIGGLEVVATDAAFPNVQPQAGVVISISDAGGVVFNGSGSSTTARTVGGSTVTINNAPSSLNNETLVAGVGLMVSSTGSSQIYNYHKILGKEDDIKQLSDDINDFNARYRVGSSNPTSALDSGDLFFNTGSGKLLVYNGTNSAWEEAQSIGNYYINTISSYSGTGGNSASFNGAAYRFVLSNPGAVAEQHIVSINGVIQKPNSGTSQPSEGFAIDGSSIIFSSAPASSADFFIITIGSTVNIGTPTDGTVSTAKLTSGAVTTVKIADDAVTTAKIAADAITGAKIADDQINSEHYVDGSIDTAHIADSQVTTAKIADGAVTTAKLADDAVTFAKVQNISTARMLGNVSGNTQDIQQLSAANVRTFINVEDGATASSGTTINNNADNRVITGSGTANTLNGESTFVYDTSENAVGIGTSSPTPTASYYQGACLHIHQAASGGSVGAQVHLTNDYGGSAAGDGSQVSHYNHSLYINNQENGDTYFYNNGSPTLTIKANGSVGVNTQSPSDKLHVNGTATIGSNLYLSNNTYIASNKGIYFDGGTGSANYLDDYEEGSHSTTDASGASLSIAGSMNYVKIGRLVQVLFDITWPSTSDGGQAAITLPFSAAVYGSGIVGWCTDPTQLHIANNTCSLMDSDSNKHKTNSQVSGQRFIGECIYFTST